MTVKASENTKLIWGHIDPSTNSTRVADDEHQISRCIDVSGYNNVMCVLFRLVGTGSIQEATLYAATSVAGAGLTAITSSGSTEMTQVVGTAGGTIAARGAGMIVLETNVYEIDATLANADFVNVKVSFATATDEVGTLWVLTNPRYAQAGLSKDGSGTTM